MNDRRCITKTLALKIPNCTLYVVELKFCSELTNYSFDCHTTEKSLRIEFSFCSLFAFRCLPAPRGVECTWR